ncbi:MAG: hypothetical protein R2779_08245 [Crocinitomicaceae bacterium]
MDLIVTQLLAMHITIALQKKIVLMNNIFNPHEFELYGRGVGGTLQRMHLLFRWNL